MQQLKEVGIDWDRLTVTSRITNKNIGFSFADSGAEIITIWESKKCSKGAFSTVSQAI